MKFINIKLIKISILGSGIGIGTLFAGFLLAVVNNPLIIKEIKEELMSRKHHIGFKIILLLPILSVVHIIYNIFLMCWDIYFNFAEISELILVCKQIIGFFFFLQENTNINLINLAFFLAGEEEGRRQLLYVVGYMLMLIIISIVSTVSILDVAPDVQLKPIPEIPELDELNKDIDNNTQDNKKNITEKDNTKNITQTNKYKNTLFLNFFTFSSFTINNNNNILLNAINFSIRQAPTAPDGGSTDELLLVLIFANLIFYATYRFAKWWAQSNYDRAHDYIDELILYEVKRRENLKKDLDSQDSQQQNTSFYDFDLFSYLDFEYFTPLKKIFNFFFFFNNSDDSDGFGLVVLLALATILFVNVLATHGKKAGEYLDINRDLSYEKKRQYYYKLKEFNDLQETKPKTPNSNFKNEINSYLDFENCFNFNKLINEYLYLDFENCFNFINFFFFFL